MTPPTKLPAATAETGDECEVLHDAARNALARVIAIQDALEDGDYSIADAIARDLEADLLGAVGSGSR